MIFQVEIFESNSRVEEIGAETREDALSKVRKAYEGGIAANLLGRRFLGIEREEEFAAISKARREEIEDIKTYSKYKKKIPDIVKAEDTQMCCFSCNEPLEYGDLPF